MDGYLDCFWRQLLGNYKLWCFVHIFWWTWMHRSGTFFKILVFLFWCGQFLKSYWICYNIASVCALGFWSRGMWDLSFLTRDRNFTPCIGRCSLNTGLPGKSLQGTFWHQAHPASTDSQSPPKYSCLVLLSHPVIQRWRIALAMQTPPCRCKPVPALIMGLCHAQSRPTLCDPRDCSLPGSSLHGDSPGKNAEVGCHALLQGIFPTQGSNQGLPHCKHILYHLSQHGVINRYKTSTR